jgi:hypothetical protein
MGCCKSNFIRNESIDISLENSQSGKSANKFFNEIIVIKPISCNFQQIMNNCEFKEIIVFSDFEVENGVLGLDRDCYLSIVKFLDSSILRKVRVNIFCFF